MYDVYLGSKIIKVSWTYDELKHKSDDTRCLIKTENNGNSNTSSDGLLGGVIHDCDVEIKVSVFSSESLLLPSPITL